MGKANCKLFVLLGANMRFRLNLEEKQRPEEAKSRAIVILSPLTLWDAMEQAVLVYEVAVHFLGMLHWSWWLHIRRFL